MTNDNERDGSPEAVAKRYLKWRWKSLGVETRAPNVTEYAMMTGMTRAETLAMLVDLAAWTKARIAAGAWPPTEAERTEWEKGDEPGDLHGPPKAGRVFV